MIIRCHRLEHMQAMIMAAVAATAATAAAAFGPHALTCYPPIHVATAHSPWTQRRTPMQPETEARIFLDRRGETTSPRKQRRGRPRLGASLGSAASLCVPDRNGEEGWGGTGEKRRVPPRSNGHGDESQGWGKAAKENGEQVPPSAAAEASNGVRAQAPRGDRVPRHVALILDGNGRWAARRNLPTSAGHARGAENVVATLRRLRRRGVTCATLFAFSTENWNRPSDEVGELMWIMEQKATVLRDVAVREGMLVRVLGDVDGLPEGLRTSLLRLERDTAEAVSGRSDVGLDVRRHPDLMEGIGNKIDPMHDAPMTVCVAINYGGRRDIVEAAKRLAAAAAAGDTDLDEVDEEEFSSNLSTAGVPDPDLIIRTGGEHRLSNFLLWNAAYAELYFTDALWPDFDDACLSEALSWYADRERRFGRRTKQRESTENWAAPT